MKIISVQFVRDALKTAAVTAAALATVSTASHAGGPQPVYTMTVFEDTGHGRLVTAGEYQRAIDAIESGASRRTSRFEVRTSLCVAQTKLGQLADASETCGDAVDMARNRTATTSNVTYSAMARTQLALALSNRGVLNAVLGETDLAQRDFEEAARLRTSLSAPETNIARLDAAAAPGN